MPRVINSTKIGVATSQRDFVINKVNLPPPVLKSYNYSQQDGLMGSRWIDISLQISLSILENILSFQFCLKKLEKGLYKWIYLSFTEPRRKWYNRRSKRKRYSRWWIIIVTCAKVILKSWTRMILPSCWGALHEFLKFERKKKRNIYIYIYLVLNGILPPLL